MKTKDLQYLQVVFSHETADLHAALVALVHGVNREHGNHLGLDYADWPAGTPAPGSMSVRIFGTADALALFASQQKAKRLATLCGFSLQPKSVPVTSEFAAVMRDNRADRVKPSYSRRLAKRAAARAEPSPATVSSADRACQATVSLTSTSTGQSFLLKLRKVFVEAGSEVVFNSYGLCKHGGLPQF